MFSEREKKIIKIIGEKQLTYKEIASKLFKKQKVLDSSILVSNSVGRIIKKCSYYNLDWTLIKDGKPAKIKKLKKSETCLLCFKTPCTCKY